jgi:hypothetical protein
MRTTNVLQKGPASENEPWPTSAITRISIYAAGTSKLSSLRFLAVCARPPHDSQEP